MAIVQSNKCLFQVLVDDVYKTVMCLRSFSVNPVTTEKETTTPIDGKFKDFDYKQLSLRVSLDGVSYRETTGDTLYDFAEQQLNFIEINFRALFIDEAGNYKIFKGQAIVMDCNFQASAGNIASGTVELLCKGEYTIENTLPQFVNLRILLYNDPMAQAFVKFWLIDATGQPVFQTDTLPQASGGQLANPLDITVSVPKGSWYYWFQMDSNNVGNVMSLDAPPTRSVGFNNGVYNEGSYPAQLYDFTANRTLSVAMGVQNPPPSCVTPGITSDLNNPSGTVGTPWSGTVVLSGSQPFTITNVVKPAWMDITIVGNTITLQGNPTAGINQIISFDINNACGTLSFADTIDISSNPDAVLINFSFDEGTSFQAMASAFRLYVNATLVAALLVDGSSNYICNPGDVVEVQVVGVNGVVKHIDIQDTVAGEIYNANSTLVTHSHSFTTILGHDYTINATAGV